MAETQRLSVWGWFVRAFAGGIGAMFGVITALMFACIVCYALFAVGALAFSTLGNNSFGPPIVLDGSANYPATTSTPQAAAYYAEPVAANPYAPVPQPVQYVAEQPAYSPYATTPAEFPSSADTNTDSNEIQPTSGFIVPNGTSTTAN
ncbi:MAG: hypothetical protein H8E66_16755 [Planctomycetes bacterium]|nr:hypothetical protein [Planctomycetota bacterium]